jgi:hypothetical protein
MAISLSGFLIKADRNTLIRWSKVSPNVDIDKKPLAVISKVAGLTAGVLYAFVLSAMWSGNHI